ncbi:DNA-binding transcriptional LysR family regulator [Rhodoligotrophos appendicifer]|uniref:LysR family transcriptional regulator n=1 Tax=Rhodoligotrophos appendicifer TaxID=987056 RepID=UPI001184C464|nr:LysR family transcriptional regulator [Rhodoligotrophos appendicifer]
MDQLSAMRVFTKVVEAGTLTRASQLTQIPKATASKLIQELEAHLRTKLLNRTTRRVTVTSDGAAYYERVVRILSDLDELDGMVSQSQAKPQGRLRVDMVSPLAQLVVLPALPGFHDLYPDIQIDIGIGDRAVDLTGENVDCVLRSGELRNPSLVARRIGELPFVTCATPAYLERFGTPAHPTDFERDHPVVSYFSQALARHLPFSFTRGEEMLEVNGRYIISVNDSSAYLAAGMTGLGAIQTPRFMVSEQFATGALLPILEDWTAETMPLYVVYPPNRHLSNRLRIFVDWVAGLFAGR